MVIPFFIIFTSINSFPVGILSSFLDRMHRVQLCSVVVLSSLLLSFSIISSDDDVMFRSDNNGFICWRSSPPINHNSLVILVAIFIFPSLPSSPLSPHCHHLSIISRVHMGPCVPYFINTTLVFLFITAGAQILCCHILLILLVQREMVHVSGSIM